MAIFKVIKSLIPPYRYMFQTETGVPSEAIAISSDANPTGILLRRVDSYGTIQEDAMPSPYLAASYNQNDQIHVKEDFGVITSIKAPNNKLDKFTVDTAEFKALRHLDLRNNPGSFYHLDFRQSPDLEIIDMVDTNWGIDSDEYPAASKWKYITLGKSDASKADVGHPFMYQFLNHLRDNNTVSNGYLYSDYVTTTNDVSTHEYLVNTRGWDIGMMTVGPGGFSVVAGGTSGMESVRIMSSKYDTFLRKDDSTWFSLDQPGVVPKSNTITTLTVSADANNTGAIRTGKIYVDKLYDDGTTFPSYITRTINIEQESL